MPEDFLSNLFSFEFKPGNGRNGVKQIIYLISYLSGFNIYLSFRLFDVLCGVMYIAIYLVAVRNFVYHRSWQIIVGIAGITSPLMLIFFGHIESYAPVYLILLSWLVLLVSYFNSQKSVYLWVLIPLLLIGVRFHTLMFLLIPALILSIAYHLLKNDRILNRIFTLKGILKMIYLPLLIIGMVLYFFVIKDYNDPRILTNFEDIDRLFLPILSPEAPFDNYNLLSFNHFFDFINVVLLWSTAILFLLVYFIYRKKNLNCSNPLISILILTLLLYTTFLFAINPLFSMPMDWDLFMFPVPVILIIIIAFAGQLKEISISKSLVYASIGLLILNISVFSVFLVEKSASSRMEHMGIHIYKTYYEHSSTYILYSLQNLINSEEYLLHETNIIDKLKPYSNRGDDKQFADLLIDHALIQFSKNIDAIKSRELFLESIKYRPLSSVEMDWLSDINNTLISESYNFPDEEIALGNTYLEKGIKSAYENNNPEKTLQYLKKAEVYSPASGEIIFHLVQVNFILEDYETAFIYADQLNHLQYPSLQTSLKILIQMSLETKKYSECLLFCRQYIETFSNDRLILTIKERLEQNDKVDELRFLFKRK